MLISIASHRQESRKIGEPGLGAPRRTKKPGIARLFSFSAPFGSIS
jgi:hypothetical protein